MANTENNPRSKVNMTLPKKPTIPGPGLKKEGIVLLQITFIAFFTFAEMFIRGGAGFLSGLVLIVVTYGGVAYGRTGTNAHVRADDGVRPDADSGVKLRALVHQRCGMDDGHLGLLNQGSVRMVHMSSASQAIWSSTRAVPLNLKIPDFMRSSVTSMIS